MCLCSRNQRNSRASSYSFSKYWASLPFCTLLSKGSPKESPLCWWSSTDPRILLLMSCCTNPTHIAGLSAHTLVLLETFILKKEKKEKNKKLIKPQWLYSSCWASSKTPSTCVRVFPFISEFTVKRGHNLSECGWNSIFSNKLHMSTWVLELPYAMILLGWQEVNR